jgi:hypothetical protein
MNFSTQLDDNGYPCIWGVSCVDGKTPVKIVFTSNGMKVDEITTISYTPPVLYNNKDDNDRPITTSVSTADGKTVLPWNVVPSTGAVLVDMT